MGSSPFAAILELGKRGAPTTRNHVLVLCQSVDPSTWNDVLHVAVSFRPACIKSPTVAPVPIVAGALE